MHVLYICTAPTVPLELSIMDVTNSSIVLSWKPPRFSSTPVVKYVLEWRKVSEPSNLFLQETKEHYIEITGLTANTEYQFKVAAINHETYGLFTDVLSQYTSMYRYVVTLYI